MKLTKCPLCQMFLVYGQQTVFGTYDEASALLNHIESDHPESELEK